jgi:hypothetical protein
MTRIILSAVFAVAALAVYGVFAVDDPAPTCPPDCEQANR